VGLWLSVGATLGIAVLARPLADIIPGPRSFRLAGGVTLAAQLGVATPSLVIFGRLPVISLVCNLAAVPVAGLVMLVGLPVGLLSGLAPWAAPVLLAPMRIATAWIYLVARGGLSLQPSAAANALLWLALIGLLARRWYRVRRRARDAHGGAAPTPALRYPRPP
jgi:competence protein ComEC